jgi:hypothetical protein
MNKFLSLIFMSILAAPLLLAADQKAAPVATSPKPAEQPAADQKAKPTEQKATPTDESAPVVVKNKSSFHVDAGTRSPFWPISWKPTGKIASGGTDQGEVPPGAFLVTSITVDGTARFAIVNGKTMSEGQQFGLQIGTQVYQVMIKRIEDGRVILGRHDEEIVVPLRRK